MKKLSNLLLITLLFILPGCARKDSQQVLSADNVVISYDVQGEGKPALVFVHGSCCDKSYWKYQVPYFAKKHKVVTIDLAGHGDSGLGREDYTITAFGGDVTAVVNKLRLDEVILIGHSLGGPVIIEAAQQMPKRVIGLVGVDTFQDLDAVPTQEQIDEFLAPFEADFAGHMRDFARGMFTPNADPTLVKWVAEDTAAAQPEVGIGAARGFFDFDIKEALKEVRKPIYCINSDMHPTNIEANRRYAASFEVKLMPGIGHFVMMEDPEEFNRLLAETITELRKINYAEKR